jgi:hypothetical protein
MKHVLEMSRFIPVLFCGIQGSCNQITLWIWICEFVFIPEFPSFSWSISVTVAGDVSLSMLALAPHSSSSLT